MVKPPVLPSILLGLTACCCNPGRPPSAFPNADAALGRMKATFACTNGVQGNAKIDHVAPQTGRVRGDVYLFAINPDRVRFDVVSPFGASLYTLTSDGTHFQMLDVKEKQFLEGSATACNLARFTQVPVPGHALVSILRGEAPILVHRGEDATITWESGGYYKVLIPSTRDAHEEIHLGINPADVAKPWNEQRVRVLDVVISQRGTDLYHAELGNHAPLHTAPARVDPDHVDPDIPPSGGACDAEAPRSIRLRVPNTEEDVIFQYKDATWNPPIAPGAFSIPFPGGVTRRTVECSDSQPTR